MKTITHAFVVPGQEWPIDGQDPETGLSCVQGETLEQIQFRYPGAVVMSYAEWQAQRPPATTAPVQITADQWMEWLCVLPPLDWVRRSGAESFKLCEFTRDDVTLCCVRIGNQYWSMQQRASTSHDALCRLCLDA